MTEPRELVPAFSVDLEPTEAGANRGAHELTAFAAEHGVADRVRERLAGVTADAMNQLAALRRTSEPITVEADIDQGNVQVVFSRDLESREAVAAARSALSSVARLGDEFSIQRAGDGATIEVWICFSLT